MVHIEITFGHGLYSAAVDKPVVRSDLAKQKSIIAIRY